MNDKQLFESIKDLIERARISQSCIACNFFNEESEGCELAQGARPPARVIATGCPRFFEKPPF